MRAGTYRTKIAKLLLTGAFLVWPVVVNAGTMTTITTIEQKDLARGQEVNFMAFDINGDNMLSMREVGTKLFYLFDRDGNMVIDNIEFDRNTILTIVPMEKSEVTIIDYNNDGTSEVSSYRYEDFMRDSHLMVFDKDRDGLSPHEFINQGFLQLDDNHDKTLDVEEWKEAYLKYVLAVNEPERYNN